MIGPVSGPAIVDALRSGAILPGDLACRTDRQDWLLVTSVPEVAAVFAPRASTPPIAQDPWNESVWMVGDLDGEILRGPVSLDDVRGAIASGGLSGSEVLARVGSTAWQPIGHVMELGRAARSVPPPAMGRGSERPAPAPPRPVAQTERPPLAAPMPSMPSPSQSPPRPSFAQPSAPVAPAPPLIRTAPPPPPRPVSDVWYVSWNGQTTGPYTLDGMRRGVASGELSSETYVCTAEEPHWRRIGDVPELMRRSSPPPLPRRR